MYNTTSLDLSESINSSLQAGVGSIRSISVYLAKYLKTVGDDIDVCSVSWANCASWTSRRRIAVAAAGARRDATTSDHPPSSPRFRKITNLLTDGRYYFSKIITYRPDCSFNNLYRSSSLFGAAFSTKLTIVNPSKLNILEQY
ncbi:hypothetical protein Zmor_010090 [Zophobas morio]|uniref:Uncharacterized protein n=1 Tax=Zophobas morio TaxID=2755281 RepID=A0AA38IQX0_9CUCU|nr:hypothetical protein Zmor_010090 [Zophobas morio]